MEVLATLQMLLVFESGSEKMCIQSPVKNRQTVRSKSPLFLHRFNLLNCSVNTSITR